MATCQQQEFYNLLKQSSSSSSLGFINCIVLKASVRNRASLFFIDSKKIHNMLQRGKKIKLERGYQMSSVLENSSDSQYSVCPAGSGVLPDFKEENLPVFEMNILLLLVSCFLILHYVYSLIFIKKRKPEGCTHAARSLLEEDSWLKFSKLLERISC